MKISHILRVIITFILVVFLLAVGFISLLAFSVEKVVLTSSYFGEDLLYSGTYSNIYSYVIDTYVPTENTDDMTAKAGNPIASNIVHSIKPTVFSDIASSYLSDWMKYLLAEVSENEIPVLNIGLHKDSFYVSAIAATKNDEFVLALLDKEMQSRGDSIDNYSEEELTYLIEELQIKESYQASIDSVLNNPDLLFYKTDTLKDPLVLLKYAAPDLSEDELLAKIKSFHGMLDYYKALANLIFAGILACLGIIIILWINRLSVPFLLNGIIIILSGIPLFVISISTKALNRVVEFGIGYLPDTLPDVSHFDFYNNLAIMPIIDHMLIVAGITIASGLMCILFSVLLKKEKVVKKPVPKAELE